jgi:hypothetical protein
MKVRRYLVFLLITILISSIVLPGLPARAARLALPLTGPALQEDLNQDPTDILLTPASVAENEEADTPVGTFTTIDPDDPEGTAEYTYTLVSGGEDFYITGDTLFTLRELDHEVDHPRTILVRTEDGAGGLFEKTFEIEVTDVNEAPTALLLSTNSVLENQPAGTLVGSLSTEDPDDGDSHTYTLLSGSEDFQIEGSALMTAKPFDYEEKASYSILVRSTDSGGLYIEQQFTIQIEDVLENQDPTDILLAPASVAENEEADTPVGTFKTIDPDDPEGTAEYTYTLVSGGDDFYITGNTLFTLRAFDHEVDHPRTILVRTEDGAGGSFEKSFDIEIIDVNEAPSAVLLSTNTVLENQPAGTVVGTLSTEDPDDGDTHTYTLIDESGEFQIDGSALKTARIFDYEEEDSYSILVRSTDSGGLYIEQQFTIQIRNQPPTGILLNPASVAENQPAGTKVGTFTTLVGPNDDSESHTYTYTPVSGSADFYISGSTLFTARSFDHEKEPSRTIRVRAEDSAGDSIEKTFEIEITDVNEAPQARGETYAVHYNESITIAAPGVLANDSDPDADDWLRAVLVDSPQHASAFTLGGDGAINYRPHPGFLGEDSFTYRARDRRGLESELVTVKIIVYDDATPTVNWVAPVGDNETYVTGPGRILLAAEAQDDVEVQYVEFRIWKAPHWVVLGRVTEPPYELEISTFRLHHGYNEIQVMAVDNAYRESAQISIHVVYDAPYMIYIPVLSR